MHNVKMPALCNENSSEGAKTVRRNILPNKATQRMVPNNRPRSSLTIVIASQFEMSTRVKNFSKLSVEIVLFTVGLGLGATIQTSSNVDKRREGGWRADSTSSDYIMPY